MNKSLIYVVVAVIIAAILGFLGFTISQKAPENEDMAHKTAETGAVTASVVQSVVIADINGKKLTSQDYKDFIATLPPQMQGMPDDQLFPLVQEQLVTAEIISQEAQKKDIENTPEFAKELKDAKDQILRSLYLRMEIEKNITPEKLKAAYEDYIKAYQAEDEIKAKHILVADEAAAKKIINELNSGASFDDLAKQNSIDKSSETGDLGYFTAKEMALAFSDAAFKMNAGDVSKEPVKTEFGYHIIKVEDKRKKAPPAFDEMKSMLESSMRTEMLDAKILDMKKNASVKIFDLQGKEMSADKLIKATGQ